MSEVESGTQGAVEVQTPVKDDYVLHSETVAKEAAVQVADKPEPQEETQESTESSEQAPKKKGGFQRKIDNQSARIAQLEQLLAEKQAGQGQQPSQNQQKQSDPNREPLESDYEDGRSVLDFVKDHNAWAAKQAIRSYEEKQAEAAKKQKADAEYKQKEDAYTERADTLLETRPTFYEDAAKLYQAGLVTPQLESAVLDSPVGEKVTMYLLDNVQELQAIAQMNDVQTYRAIALIEAKLGNQPEGQAAVRQTRAAAPISPVKTVANTQRGLSDDMSFEDYKKQREKDLRR